jgi:glycerophosphoryl diester phosphodiesterase
VKRLILVLIILILPAGGGCVTYVPDDPDPGPYPVERIQTSSGSIRPLMIAHRCGAGLGPENTCYAVVQSSFYRPDYYEIDIRHTLDGIPVCMHDATLDRTTDMAGDISGLTWEEIRTADAGSWHSSTSEGEPIPLFETMLDCVNPSPLAIEIKEPEITPVQCNRIAGILTEREDDSSVILSFHRSALETYREADPSRRTCFLTAEFNGDCLEGEHDIVGLLASKCTESVVIQIHEAGKVVWVWTVNENYTYFMEIGVDGIVTDWPDRLRDVLPPS